MASAIERADQTTAPAGGNGRPPKGTGTGSAGRPGGLLSTFTAVHKKGQGFWTRLGTGVAGAGFVLLTANFVYRQLEGPLRDDPAILWAIVGGILAVGAVLGWWLLNRPKHADFLIATDSEMKKVNWTTQAELIGSTKVVIIFMLAIAALLFVTDVVFGYFFWLIDVLHTKPF